jgi:DNA-binding beta-propeller fold protein YncE
MHKFRCVLLFGCSILLGAKVLSTVEPAAIATLSSGEVLVLDSVQGVVKISERGRSQVVRGFEAFQGADLATAPSDGGESVFVTLQIRFKSDVPFSRLCRWTVAGKRTGEWLLGNGAGILAGVAVDPRQQIAYCSDVRSKTIYKLNLNKPGAKFEPISRINGTPGALILDAKRRRLLVADVETGKILAVGIDSGQVDTLLDKGSIVEPVALAFDESRDRLYIADAAKRRVWFGNAAADRLKIEQFAKSQGFSEPVGLAVGRDGTLWVADRGSRLLLLLTPDGASRQKIPLK